MGRHAFCKEPSSDDADALYVSSPRLLMIHLEKDAPRQEICVWSGAHRGFIGRVVKLVSIGFSRIDKLRPPTGEEQAPSVSASNQGSRSHGKSVR